MKETKDARSEIIQIKDLSYEYGDGTTALNGVNLSVKQGEKLALLGANGSGKTTLFLCLIGILKPTSGEIAYDGQPIRYDKKGMIRLRKKIGIIFQDPDTQIFCINVFQEVAFGPSNMGLSDEDIRRRTEASMKKTDVAHLEDKAPHFLSYGQKKRVSAASVLAMEPDILIFDEPTSALDPFHAKGMMALIDELNGAGITVCLSTHDMDLALSWSDTVAVMKDGRVIGHGAPEQIFADEALFLSADLYQPTVFRLYHFMRSHHLVANNSTVPRTVEALEALIEEAQR